MALVWIMLLFPRLIVTFPSSEMLLICSHSGEFLNTSLRLSIFPCTNNVLRVYLSMNRLLVGCTKKLLSRLAWSCEVTRTYLWVG